MSRTLHASAPRHAAPGSRGRRWLAVTGIAALVSAGIVSVPLSSQASTVTSAAFTASGAGQAKVGTTLYARSGVTLTLTVNTSNDTQCVDIAGAFTGHQEGAAKSQWTFTFNTPSGDGAQSVTATAQPNVNAQSKCTGTSGSGTASYTLDNTAPSVTAAVSPAANAAGWHKANIAIAWSATDTGGSGVTSGPTPATDSQTASTSAAGATKTATATDAVGNIGTGSVTVKLDKAAPTISGSRSPAANANGWNNTDVTASFTCSDTPSGIKTCPSPTTLSAGGANQSVIGTAVDNADNSTSVTVSGISIDTVSPTLSGAPTTSPNANGWYKGDVTVAWTAADALSGLAGSAPANATIAGEGLGKTASTSVTDRAGNTTTATSAPAVNIDTTTPLTSVTAPPAWNKTDVTLALTANDALSGVASTSYRLDGGATQTGTSVTVSTEGQHTLSYWSTDRAGNVEATRTVQVNIDKTSPTIFHNQSPVANPNGWNKTNVTVTFSCADALSGIASCTGPQTVTTEGANQAVTGTATDNAGNTATDPARVSIDRTAPTLTLTRDRAPNAAGWYNDDVVVGVSCADTLSGVDGCPAGATLGEGANQSVTRTATDAAGNTTTATTSGIDIDKTAPSVSGTATTAPVADGWYAGDVTIAWTCSDALSGLAAACPATATITGEGAALGASQSATDRAGNTATGTVSGIKIDRTAPTTTVSGVPGDVPGSGAWQDTPVTLTFSALDALSGVDKTYVSVDGIAAVTSAVTLGDGDHAVSYWSVDAVGNLESARSAWVRVDTQLPTITSTQTPAANGNGWNNTAVLVEFSCADQAGLSGIASCAPQSRLFGSEGRAQTQTGTATDRAGNTQTATASVDIDLTAPAGSAAVDRAANANGWYRDPVTVTTVCSDLLSGVDVCPPSQTFGEGTGQGYSGAVVDAAGNTTPVSVTGINVDRTDPTLSAAATTSPNAAGWFKAPVTFQWTCADAGGSGIDGSCPTLQTIADEGVGQRVAATVQDRAGNVAEATSAAVRIDRTAPITEANAPTGWVNNDVQVTLTPSDNLSGVATTHYTVNGGATQTGTSIDLPDEGTYALTFWSVDAAGNAEAARSATVEIDKTNPRIEGSQDPTANLHGWNNTSVQVSFSCTDDLSQIASCTAPRTLTAEGANQGVTGTATDNAGNSASTTQRVNIDLTPPTIAATRTPAANAAGWTNVPVAVSFTCADTLSNTTACGPDTTVGDATDASVTGAAEDAAGNTASATVNQINVDQANPTIVGAPTAAANADDWYRGNVIIGWTCDDDRSGVAGCPAGSTITGEGEGLTASATVLDRAGNRGDGTSPAVRVDRHAPTTEIAAPSGWLNEAVTVVLTPNDGLSGVAATFHTVDGGPAATGATFTVTGEGEHAIAYWSVDRAGNVEASRTATVRIDLTDPTIGHTVTPAPNARGWNRTVPVTVAFSCADAGGSGVDGCGPTPQTFTADGEGQVAGATATDGAGNVATDSATVSIDTAAPSISAAADRAPTRNGWYADDVTVAFTCSDPLSGIAACPAAEVLGEGANQSASGSASDNAGNTASASRTGINVDKTRPTLVAAPTTVPNAAGWYTAPVRIRWTPSDLLSGVDLGTAPGDSTLDQDGPARTATETVSDLAGNVRTATSDPVKIDTTAPGTTVDAPVAWQNSAVTLSLTASDATSGVAATHYTVDGGPTQTGDSVTIADDGVHTLAVWSVDVAGNSEPRTTFTLRLDRTAPEISGSISPAPNLAGWNSTDATVHFSCTDQTGLSGIASCTPDVAVTSEGARQPIAGTAVDVAGNRSSTSVEVSVDKTAPTISGSIIDPEPSSYGWYKLPVTVHFECADQLGLSGVASCSPDSSVGQGGDQSVTGTARDGAGNQATASVQHIDVDTTDPLLSGAATTAPNGAGWYRGDVTVRWTCSDALSGVPAGGCPADSTVTGEGTNRSATATVADRAGNSASGTVSGLKLDRTDPVTAASAPAGWRRGVVTVGFSASDNLSGVARTVAKVDGGADQVGSSVTVSGTGTHTVTYWSVDVAGNTETAATVTVLIDDIAPTISGAVTPAANANGWRNVNTTVHFTCGDTGGSLLVSGCPADVVVPETATAGQVVSGAVEDGAGNRATATVTVKVDKTGPVVGVGGVAGGASYRLGTTPAATCTASDPISGLDGACTVAVTGGTASGVGTFTATATAKDKAGNTATTSVSYTVVYGWAASFFLQPINDTAHQVGQSTSIFKAGSTVPVKFQLLNAAGQPVQASSAPIWENPVSKGSTSAAVNETPVVTSDTSSTFRWDATAQQYIYTWNTAKSQVNQYWQIGVKLDDGTTQFVTIGLR